MKLIKINTDHYIVVDDSEIKEGDYSFYPPFGIGKNIIIDKELCFYIEPKNNTGSFTQRTDQTLGKNKKIIRSTLPLEFLNEVGFTTANLKPDWSNVIQLLLSEVKELLGEVDVEKKAEELTSHLTFPEERREGIIIGYNQALEDNKDKKYTEEDLLDAFTWGFMEGTERGDVTDSVNKFSQSLQPKTEWEVEFDENSKLKLV